MSIQVMSAVWKSADVKGGSLLVLLALADFADDNGYCWPSVRTLGEKARLSETQTHEAIRQLQALKLLRIDPRPGSSNRYLVTLGGAETAGVGGADSGGGGVQETGGGGVRPTAPKPSKNRQLTVKPRVTNFPRSDDSDKDRPPDARVERWLVAEMNKHFGAKVVQKHLAYCELFFVWRKIKQYVDDGDRATLKELMPRAQAEYNTEIEQIKDGPPETDYDWQMLAIYHDIEAKRQAEYKAEYEAWERENYPVVAGAK